MTTSVMNVQEEPPATPGNQTGGDLASPMPPMPPPPFNTPCGASVGSASTTVGPGTADGHGAVSSSSLADKLSGLTVEDAPPTPAGAEETPGDDVHEAEADESGDMEDDDEEDDEDDEDGDEVDLPPEVMKRLYQLKALQSEKDVVYAQYKEERAQLENKFAKLYGAIYAQRALIVSGRGESAENGEREGTISNAAEEEKEVGVPHFWMQCMLHHEALRDVVCEGDLEALYYLSDVRCVDKENLLGFTLEFHFDENPFFSNPVLMKRYDTANIMDQGEPLLEGVEGTKIQWKSGRNLCERIIRRRPKRGGKGGSRGSGETRMVTKVEKTDSFFKFFLNPVMYDDQDEDEDDDEEQYNFSFDMDYEIARIFRNHLIPNAVLWFTGEAVSEDEEDEEDDDDDEDDDEASSSGVGLTVFLKHGRWKASEVVPSEPSRDGLGDTDGLSDEEGGVRGEGEKRGSGNVVKALDFQAPAGAGASNSGSTETQECKQS